MRNKDHSGFVITDKDTEPGCGWMVIALIVVIGAVSIVKLLVNAGVIQ